MKLRALSLIALSASLFADEAVVAPATVAGTLEACAQDVYRITLREGDVVRGSVEQEAVDLVVRVVAPNGMELDRTVRAHDPGAGTERFMAIAPEPGEYRVIVGTEKGEAAPYRLTVAAVERASGDDLAIVAGRGLLNVANLDSDASIAALEQAAALCRSANGPECESDALQSLGQRYWHAGRDLAKGREYLRQSLRIRERLDDRLAERSVLNDLGVLSRWMGELLDAREYYERAIAIPSPDGVPDFIHLHNLASVYWQMGELQKALDLEHRAMEGFTRTNDRVGIGYVLVVLGKFQLQLGNPQEALRLHQAALERWTETGWAGGIAESLLQLGTDQEALGERGQAMRTFREALRNFEKDGQPAGQGRTKLKMAALLLRDGDVAGAMEASQSALTLLRASGYDDTDAIRVTAAVHAAKGDATEALAQYRQALDAYRASSDRVSQLETQVALARLDMREGRFDAAQSTLEEALTSLEALRYSLVSPAERASYLAARQSIFDLSIAVRMRRNEPRAAFELSERARARSLLDALPLARMARESGIDPSLLRREEELRSRISGKAAAMQTGDRARATALRSELQSLLAEHRRIDAEMLRSDPRFEQLLAGSPASLDEIQRHLDDDVLLVEYSLSDDGSWVWAVTSKSVVSIALAPRAEIEAAAREAVRMLPLTRKREMLVPARRALSRLSHLVLRPIAAHLRGRRLVVVADGALQSVPFGALPDAKGEPLLAAHEIVSLPSASLIPLLRRQRRLPGDATVAIVADPVLTADDPRVTGKRGAASMPADLVRSLADFGDTSFPRLLHTRAEAAAIAALLPPQRRVQMLDFEASRARAISGILAGARVVHFASHALINDRHPELSGLVLSLVDRKGEPQDGFLRLMDVYKLQLDAELVVLSACRTAQGRDVTREGLVGLARGFMHAGAPRVVASLWDVRDAATAELMKRFYTSMLRDKKRPAAALRAAQLSLRSEPRWSAPVYWAGFTLQGEWR